METLRRLSTIPDLIRFSSNVNQTMDLWTGILPQSWDPRPDSVEDVALSVRKSQLIHYQT